MYNRQHILLYNTNRIVSSVQTVNEYSHSDSYVDVDLDFATVSNCYFSAHLRQVSERMFCPKEDLLSPERSSRVSCLFVFGLLYYKIHPRKSLLPSHDL